MLFRKLNTTEDKYQSAVSGDMMIDRIYPSPASDHVRIEFQSQVQTKIELFVTDLLGNIVLKKEISAREGLNQIPLNVNDLPPAMYFVSIAGEKMRSPAKKFIKQ